MLLGRHHVAKATEDGLRKAIRYFNAADRQRILPTRWPTLAWPKPTRGCRVSTCDPRETMPKAKQAAETALRLDESLADAHAALGLHPSRVGLGRTGGGEGAPARARSQSDAGDRPA